MVDEMKKRSKDLTLIRQKMDLTFSFRRKEIVDVQPMVLEIQERWPALFSEEQICAEFNRVTTKELLGTFRAALEEYSPRLLKPYRARKDAFGQQIHLTLQYTERAQPWKVYRCLFVRIQGHFSRRVWPTDELQSRSRSPIVSPAVLSITTEGQELRCRCIERRANFIPPKHIHDLERIPAGAHCERTEVIITMKGGRHKNMEVCVDPDAKWVKALMEFLAKKEGCPFGQQMENLLDKLDEQTSDIAVHRKSTALEGLPLFVCEDSGTLFKTCLETDPDDETRGVKIGIVTVLEDDVAPTSLSSIQNVAVVLEEKIVLTDLPDLPTAFACLFGLLFALNIDYPKELKYTFEVLETIFMELSTNCTQRVRSLKANLLL
ncbi:hypothetical protein AAFF_G00108830 [Aldrovandia affinis]|uniref:Chemokine interleukin-8-like domain-containing protein n=1 Tax=Aldrovandia affinis TaxID=143900 RepID=A0AAD7WBY5_9TELE|nr:hypothetical protein AAFF_G00108830 [Aldrovandia affinis]